MSLKMVTVEMEFDTEMDAEVLRKTVEEDLENGRPGMHEDGGFGVFADGIVARPESVFVKVGPERHNHGTLSIGGVEYRLQPKVEGDT